MEANHFLLLKPRKRPHGDGMKGFHPSKRPETFREKLDAVAHWGFFGLLMGLLLYPLLWQIIQQTGQLTGAEQALMVLILNPLGWVFPGLTAAGLALVPWVAVKGETEAYGRDTARMTLRWVFFLAIASTLAVWAILHFHCKDELIPLVLLLVPLPSAAVQLLGPVRGRGPADSF
jgi:hypothetical protein